MKNPADVTVLVVDDSQLNRDLMTRWLQRAGYRVAVAEGGGGPWS